MSRITKFGRCIYCFAPLHQEAGEDGEEKSTAGYPCPKCGYEDGRCMSKACWLLPGTILKGRYMVGRLLREEKTELVYLAWDMRCQCRVEIHEFFPHDCLQRDITLSEQVTCLPGMEASFETGKQEFFQRVRLYYQCIIRVEPVLMDFFVRNGTCYYMKGAEDTKEADNTAPEQKEARISEE